MKKDGKAEKRKRKKEKKKRKTKGQKAIKGKKRKDRLIHSESEARKPAAAAPTGASTEASLPVALAQEPVAAARRLGPVTEVNAVRFQSAVRPNVLAKRLAAGSGSRYSTTKAQGTSVPR
jgi:hypothetical protein